MHEVSDRRIAIAAIDDTGEVRAIERVDHPFFIATLYQPQLNSRPGAPHPILLAFSDGISTGSRR